MTPAQHQQSNFVRDWPVQGPTDEGMRAADCQFAQQRLPAKPACADCSGPLPPWVYGGMALNGAPVPGFGVGDSSDIYSQMNATQQQWVLNAINTLNTQIIATTGTTCPSWAADIQHMAGCFQIWYNANYGKSGVSRLLRTDGVLDEDTLCALKMISQLHPTDFTVFPDPQNQYCQPSSPAAQDKKMSTGAVVGIAAVGAAALAGAIYYVTRSKKGSR